MRSTASVAAASGPTRITSRYAQIAPITSPWASRIRAMRRWSWTLVRVRGASLMASSLGGQTRPGTDKPEAHSTARTGEIGARQYNPLQMLRFLTSGESHGPQLTVIVEGLPAGVSLDAARDIDPALRRR